MQRYLIALLMAVWPFAIAGAQDFNCDPAKGLVDVDKCPGLTRLHDGPDCSTAPTGADRVACTRLELKDAKPGPVLARVITSPRSWALFSHCFGAVLFFILVGHLICGSVKGRWGFDRDTALLAAGIFGTAFVGFAAGLLGPIFVSPASAEGVLTGSFDMMSPTARAPLLGVYVTGPLGALLGLGGSLFYILKLRPRPTSRTGSGVVGALKLVAISVLAPLIVVLLLVVLPAFFNVTARAGRASFLDAGLALLVAFVYVPMMIATLLLGWPLHFLFRRWHLRRGMQALLVSVIGFSGGLVVTVLVMTPDLRRLADYPALLARAPEAAYFFGVWSAFGIAAALMAWLLYAFGPLKVGLTKAPGSPDSR